MPSSAGVHPAGRREQGRGVQRRGRHEGRRQGGLPGPPGPRPLRPGLAQGGPERAGPARLPVRRLRAGADAAPRGAGEHRHPGQDGDRQAPLRQRARRREFRGRGVTSGEGPQEPGAPTPACITHRVVTVAVLGGRAPAQNTAGSHRSLVQ